MTEMKPAQASRDIVDAIVSGSGRTYGKMHVVAGLSSLVSSLESAGVEVTLEGLAKYLDDAATAALGIKAELIARVRAGRLEAEVATLKAMCGIESDAEPTPAATEDTEGAKEGGDA